MAATTGIAALLVTTSSTAIGAPKTSLERAQAPASPSLTIINGFGSLWGCVFNPYNPSWQFGTGGLIYEPLVYMDTLENGKATPWLATSWAWSDGNKVLTFTIRKGVKWSDGTPMTAADVVFTFDLLKKYPGLDLSSIWSVLGSVTQQGDNVVLKFKTAAVPYFYYVADQTYILPEHIWASVKNPVTYADADPVGTGPYTVSKCASENVVYTANPTYWQPGLPKVKTVQWPAILSASTENGMLASGDGQWGAQFIPNVKSFYLSKSPDNHYWYPPTSNVDVFINLTVAPLNQLAVRQALAYAIDRQRVSSIGEYGYEPASNQAGVVTPTFSAWLDKGLLSKYNYSYDPAKAISVLEKAGYKRGSNGIFEKNGKQLSFSIINIGAYPDWVADVQVIQQELAAVGIKVATDNLTGTAYDADLYPGKYQLAIGEETGGPTPYYELRSLLDSANTAAIGTDATTNWERYSDPATDKLFNEYSATTNTALQHTIVDQLEQVMLSDVPVVPTTEGVIWYQYETRTFSGWPTPQNPYAEPGPGVVPDDEVVLLHLVPKG
ncbi:MAG TPA: ABC transporter substrate-binding protein [Acidimicrobiales bacterium]|nr:ABC transporter substrate-binding protein [Acidimicrobiales bacterium]